MNQDDGLGSLPPSYLQSKEHNFLDKHQDVIGLVFELNKANVKLKDNDEVIYQFSKDPTSGQGEELEFNLRIYKVRGDEDIATSPRVTKFKHLYTAKRYGTWFRMGEVPPMYSFVAESRSLYCFRPSFGMLAFDNSFKLEDTLPWMSRRADPWRVAFQTDPKKKSTEINVVRKGKRNGDEYEWVDVASKQVLAVETVAGLDAQNLMPSLKWQSNVQDRRIVHALTLAWAARIWHDAKEDYMRRKAKELKESLTLKQRLGIRLYGTQKREDFTPFRP